MPNVDATPTEVALHSPPYLVISFRGYDEQSADEPAVESCSKPSVRTIGRVIVSGGGK